MAFGSDIVIDRTPVYTGREGTTSEPATTLADAKDYVNSLRDGTLDPFLQRAWTDITIRQNRNPNGTFATGYMVIVDYSAPGPGDNSGAENPDPGSDGGVPL